MPHRPVMSWINVGEVSYIVERELDLVAGGDAQPIAKIFRDHDLPFGTNPMSHTIQYNCNSGFGPQDTVYVLGDAAMGRREETMPLVGHLAGHEILFRVNHDQLLVRAGE